MGLEDCQHNILPFDIFVMFKALKLHFTNEKYDYFLYNGQVRTSPKDFDNSNERFYFLSLLKKYNIQDIQDYLVCNVYLNPKIFSGDLLSEQSQNNFFEFKKRKQSISYIFKNDLKKICEKNSFIETLQIKNGNEPIILDLFYQKDITTETFLIIDKFIGIIDIFSNKLNDKIYWPTIAFKLKRLQSFIVFDYNKIKEIFKNEALK